MARRLRLEAEAGVDHVINRGNTRSPIFRAERTKQGNLHEVSRKVNAGTRSVDMK
jgi:hypothetical protein